VLASSFLRGCLRRIWFSTGLDLVATVTMWIWLLLLPLLKAFSTTALFEQCNHQVKLQSGQKLFINSPYYPALYPVGTSCRYAVEAPKDQGLQFKCELQLKTVRKSSGNKTVMPGIYLKAGGKAKYYWKKNNKF